MNQRIMNTEFNRIYEMYLAKAEKKERSKNEVDTIIYWLTGHNEASLTKVLDEKITVGDFFGSFPKLNENAYLITGLICGYRVEEITDPLHQKMRYLDKLIDELAKGKKLEKILRAK